MKLRIALAALMICCLLAVGAAAEEGFWQLDWCDGAVTGENHAYSPDETVEGGTMCLRPARAAVSVTVEWLDWFGDTGSVTIWEKDEMAAGEPLYITASLSDTMPNLRVTCYDENDAYLCYYITDSGEDGSLILIPAQEFDAEMAQPEPDYTGLEVNGGTLIGAGYSCSGDELGNIYEAEICWTEDATLVLVTRRSNEHEMPITVKRYSAADDTLRRIAAIVREFGMETWGDRPDWLFVCDAAQPCITLYILGDDGDCRTVSISGYIEFAEGESEAYNQVARIIQEHRQDEWLLESDDIPRDFY